MSDSHFNFFDTVEDTVQGVTTFFDRFVKTVFYMGCLPHRFPARWSEESGRDSFVKPFSTTAISVFLLYLAVVFGIRRGLDDFYVDVVKDLPTDYAAYMSVTRLFVYSIPIIIVLYLAARLVSRLTVAADLRVDVASLALYGCSFQCLANAVVFLNEATLGNNLLTRIITLYGFVVCTLIVWKAMPKEVGLKALRQACIAAAYAGFCIVWVTTFIVVGFAFEISRTPAGPEILQQHDAKQREMRQQQWEAEFKPVLDKIMKDVLKDLPEEPDGDEGTSREGSG